MVIFFLLFPLFLFSLEIKVDISSKPIAPFDPVPVFVHVTHEGDQQVDHFTLGGEPLEAEFISEKESGQQIISTYQFQELQSNEGLNLLPAVTAFIGKKHITFPATTFQVTYEPPKEDLMLRAFVWGDKPFYPGERMKLVYKIYYLGNIKLIREDLPLLSATGLQKIGSILVDEGEEKGYNYQTFMQAATANYAGTYLFDTSKIIGKLPSGKEIESDVQPFHLIIDPFPYQGRPLSFTGSQGKYTLNVELLSGTKVELGKEVDLKITLNGEHVEDAKLPSIFCQPGFSGFFSEATTPLAGKMTKVGKEYLLTLRVISPEVEAIPKIEFSSFDTNTRQFLTIQSKKIPLQVIEPVFNMGKKVVSPKIVDWKPTTSEKTITYQPTLSPKNWVFELQIFLVFLAWSITRVLPWFQTYLKNNPVILLIRASFLNIQDSHFSELIKHCFYKNSSDEVRELFSFLDAVRFGDQKGSKEEVLSWAWRLLKK